MARRAGAAPGAELVSDARRAVQHQPCLGGGAAHVERDEARTPGLPGEMGSGHHARRGSGFDRIGGFPRGHCGAHHRAVRLHDLQLGADAHLAQCILEAPGIAGHCRADIGGQQRGRRALIFLEFGPDFGGEAEIGLRRNAGRDLADPALMFRIGVAVQQAYCDRLGAPIDEHSQRAFGAGFVERPDRIPARVHPLAHLGDHRAGQERGRRSVGEVEAIGADRVLLADMEQVAKAARGDQAQPRAFPLEHEIGRQRGGVDEAGDLRRIAGCGVEALADGGQHSADRIVGRGQRLDVVDRTQRVGEHEIGEGAADIDADEDAPPGHAPASASWP